jgi:hypothetical protein
VFLFYWGDEENGMIFCRGRLLESEPKVEIVYAGNSKTHNGQTPLKEHKKTNILSICLVYKY